MNDYKSCLDDVKKLMGIPPYDGYNPCLGDGYFYESIKRKYTSNMLNIALKECSEIQQKIKEICGTIKEENMDFKTVEEYSKEMTRVEFDKFTEEKELCPDQMGLINGVCAMGQCVRCWDKALVGITFKEVDKSVIPYEALNLLCNIEKAEAEYKRLGEERDKFKSELLELMEAHGVEKWENDLVSVSYIKPGVRSSVDSKKLLKDYPEVYSDVVKNSNVKSSIRIKLKGAK